MISAAPAADAPSSSNWLVRWSPLGGLLFVLGMIGVFVSPFGDDTGDTPAELLAFVDANEGWLIASMLYFLASLLFVPWFVSGLHARLRSTGAESEGAIALIGGTAFSLLFFLALTIWTAPLLGLGEESDETIRLADAQTALGIDDIGWLVLAGAGVTAGLMIIATSVAMIRGSWAPSWAGWVSLLFGLASFATLAFVGIFAWMAWIGLASVVMLARARA